MKKTLKTILCTILTMVLLLPAVYAAEVSEDGSADRASTAASESSSADTASAAETLQAQKENAEKKDILILFTSDVHCGIDKGFGYAGLEQIRKHEQDKGNEVILVDNGDNIQGDAMGLLTKGEALLDLMNKMGYSVAIPGNHEFDYGMDNFLSLAKKAQFKYISCNFQYRGENVFDSYVIREIGGRKIAFVGVTTPTTLTASTPTAFLDENGEYVYSFLEDENGEAVFNAVQSAADEARKEGAEYVIVMGHMGQEESCRPWTYADVISHTTGIDAFLDGHSHDLDQVIMKNKDGKEVPRAACGTKMQAIGWCRIPVEGELTTGIYSWTMDDSAPEVFGIENDISEAVKTARAQADKMMEEKIAIAEQELTINDPAAVDPKWGKVRMIRRAETNLGDLCTDALRIMSDADIAILGGGSIRANIPAGDVTMKNIYEQYDGNTPVIFGDRNQLSMDSIKSVKTDAPFVANDIMEYKKEIWNEALTFLGVNNLSEKRERLISDETNTNNELINLNLMSYLQPRKLACKQFNEKYGLTGDKAIDVKVRSDLDNIIKRSASVVMDEYADKLIEQKTLEEAGVETDGNI